MIFLVDLHIHLYNYVELLQENPSYGGRDSPSPFFQHSRPRRPVLAYDQTLYHRIPTYCARDTEDLRTWRSTHRRRSIPPTPAASPTDNLRQNCSTPPTSPAGPPRSCPPSPQRRQARRARLHQRHPTSLKRTDKKLAHAGAFKPMAIRKRYRGRETVRWGKRVVKAVVEEALLHQVSMDMRIGMDQVCTAADR